jgi:hypothetical protein
VKDASTRVSDERQRVEKVEIFPNNKNALSNIYIVMLAEGFGDLDANAINRESPPRTLHPGH